jgi:hypothetical protein
MGKPVVMGAALQCTNGTMPSSLIVVPLDRVMFEKKPMANTMDHIPIMNIAPFLLCTSLTNPATAALTAAALGVLTPGPCVPATATPWTPGAAKTMVASFPALTADSTCNCAFGGVIKVATPATMKENVN